MGSARVIMLAVFVAAVAVAAVDGNYSIASEGQRAAMGDASGEKASGGELREEAVKTAETVGHWVKEKVKKGLGFSQQHPQQQSQQSEPAVVAAEEGAMEYANDKAGEAKEAAQGTAKKTVEKAQDVKEKAQEQAEQDAEEVKEKAQKKMKVTAKKAEEAQESMAQKAEKAKEAATEKAEEAKDEALRWGRTVAEKGAEVGEKSSWAKEKIKGGYEATKKKAGDALDGAKEKIVGSPRDEEL